MVYYGVSNWVLLSLNMNLTSHQNTILVTNILICRILFCGFLRMCIVATDRSLMWFCVWVFATTSYLWNYMYILYICSPYAGVVCLVTKYFCDFDVICWYEICMILNALNRNETLTSLVIHLFHLIKLLVDVWIFLDVVYLFS